MPDPIPTVPGTNLSIYGWPQSSGNEQSSSTGSTAFDVMNGAVGKIPKLNQPSDFDVVYKILQGSDDPALKDLYYEYVLNENSKNTAYQRELDADSTKYQRLVKDLKAAGLNPMFALSGAGAGQVTSNGSTYNSGLEASRHSKQSEENSQFQSVASAIFSLIGTALIAIAML